MNCLNARRALCGLDEAPAAALTAAALTHARACPRCRAMGLRFADAILAAAGDELPCAECQAHLDLVALGGSAEVAWRRREPALARRVQAHLAGCPDCGAELALLRGMLAADLTAVAAGMPARFDTGFAEQAPAGPPDRRRRRRGFPVPVWLRGLPGWLHGLAGGWQGDPRAARATLAALTAVVVFALARLVLRDPGLRRSLERIAPFVPAMATADLDALRAQATGTAAARATQTALAARGSASATAGPRRPTPLASATSAASGSPVPETAGDKEDRARQAPATRPAPTSAPPTSQPAEPGEPYPPPGDPDPYPGGESAYPPPIRGVPPEPVDPTPYP